MSTGSVAEPPSVPAQRRRVCSPELLVDARARAVAGALAEPGRVPPAQFGRLVLAVEDYDLALARLLWAQVWQSSADVGQADAMAWHTKQFQLALAELVGGLRRATNRASCS
jgi:hypothetical protein